MPELKIVKRFGSYDNENEIIEIELQLDGKNVGVGSFGGEPEDNSEGRDYCWVIPTIQSIAEKLGADVKIEISKEE